jgi:hypothetical protein
MHYFLNIPSNRRIEILACSRFVLSLYLGYQIKENEIGREVDQKYGLHKIVVLKPQIQK